MSEEHAGWFHYQAETCRSLGSPLWGSVLERLATDVAAGGVTWEVIRMRSPLRFGELLPLRIMGLAHRLALAGRCPELAAVLPSCGGTANAEQASDVVLSLIGDHRSEFVDALDRAPQTNEVGRAAAFVLGMVHAQTAFGQPLRLREIGCSGGLNQHIDRFRFEQGDSCMGPRDSPVRLTDVWNRPPAFTPSLHIESIAGCDPHPVDVTTENGALQLRSFVWPDQTARFERLNGAIELARATPARLDRTLDTNGWIAAELASAPLDTTTVIFHSIVWQYIPKVDRARISETIEQAGSVATQRRPLAWLTFEPDPDDPSRAATTIRLWPGDTTLRLATADFHGRWVNLA